MDLVHSFICFITNPQQIEASGIWACMCVVCCTVAVKYNSCYAQPATSASIKSCNKTYHMEKELKARTSDDVCRYASVSLVVSLFLPFLVFLCLCV